MSKNELGKMWIVLFVMIFSLPLITQAKDLKASLAFLPNISESPEKGAFVDLVKAIDEVYAEGTIAIQVFPFARSMDNVINGKADFHIPGLRNMIVPEAKLPYRYATENMGTVVIVIYSHKDSPVTKEMIFEKKLVKPFPYKIDIGRGIEGYFDFPLQTSSKIDQSLRKVNTKRIDAFIWAQEEADFEIRNLKLKNIHRAKYGDFDDVVIIPKGPKGDEIDNIISNALKTLKSSGKMKPLYEKIHLPYNDWQPFKEL